MRRRLTVLCLFVACLLVPPIALAPPAAHAAYPRVMYSLSLPGEGRGVTVAGDLLYVASGDSGLYVFDLSYPAAPPIAGTCSLWGAGSVAAAGDYAYVIGRPAHLHVVDVSNPAAPAVAGSCELPSSPRGFAVFGTHAYVATQYAGLQVVDVSDPAAPFVAGSCSLPADALDVAVVGNLAYVANTVSGLQVIDVSNPAAPFVIGSCSVPDGAYHVAVAGAHAYVSAHSAGLQVIDVSNPVAPFVAGSVSLPGGVGSNGAGDLAAAGDFVYVTESKDDGGSLWVVDVASPAAPFLAGSCRVPGASSVAVAGDYVYLGTMTVFTGTGSIPGGLTVVDLGRPADAMAVRLTASVRPAVVGYNGLVKVKGVLSDVLSTPLAGHTVVVQRSTNGTTWSKLKMVTSSSTGALTASVRIVRKTYFRWSYAGDETYAGVSPRCSATCKASLTPPAVPSSVARGLKHTSFGYLRPQHAGGRAPITISFYRYSSGRWRPMMGGTWSDWKNVSGATRYGILYRIGSEDAGRWRVQAMHVDKDHARTYSAYRYFVVR